MDSHDCEGETAKSIFCKHCKLELVPGTLKSVRIMGFVGPQHSTSPAIEKFYATGDPSGLKSKN